MDQAVRMDQEEMVMADQEVKSMAGNVVAINADTLTSHMHIRPMVVSSIHTQLMMIVGIKARLLSHTLY
jgi:hypothetical protein